MGAGWKRDQLKNTRCQTRYWIRVWLITKGMSHLCQRNHRHQCNDSSLSLLWNHPSLSSSSSPSLFLCFPGFSTAFFFDRTLAVDEDDTASWPQLVDQHCYTSVWSKHSQGQDCLSTCFAKLVQSQETNSSTCVVYQRYTIHLYKTRINCLSVINVLRSSLKEWGQHWHCMTSFPQMLT